MSDKNSLNRRDYKAALKRGLLFLRPLGVLYAGQIIPILLTGHTLKLTDFIPNPITTGGMILYVGNRITDLIDRFIKGD